jgi:hypothetical protein
MPGHCLLLGGQYHLNEKIPFGLKKIIAGMLSITAARSSLVFACDRNWEFILFILFLSLLVSFAYIINIPW